MQEQSMTARRLLWIALLAAATVGSSLVLACAAPFAALIAVAAANMGRRDAAALAALVFISNQLIGYFVLNYPVDLYSLGWGGALGVACAGALVVADYLAVRTGGFAFLPRTFAVFAGAFAVFELVLVAFTSVLPAGEEAFSLATVVEILQINLVALIGLALLYQIGTVLGYGLPARTRIVAA